MATKTLVVDDRTFLLGLDDLYRWRMKEHESFELLECARKLCRQLHLEKVDVPVEGYYTEDERLTEYFLWMRTLQNVDADVRPRVDHLPNFQRLLEVTSSPLFGVVDTMDKLLPQLKSPLTQALEEIFPRWTIDEIVDTAHAKAAGSDDFSLVGLAALARDSVLLAATRESAALYEAVAVGCGPGEEPVTYVYEWAVDPVLEERGARFVSTFNELFDEKLPKPCSENAEAYWLASTKADVWGRCIRVGVNRGRVPEHNYHWAIVTDEQGMRVHDFWSEELWTTERFTEVLFSGKPLPRSSKL